LKLIIDIGNTAVKVALFEAKELQKNAVFDKAVLKDMLKFVDNHDISGTIISSVKDRNAELEKIINYFQALFLDYNTILPIQIDYKTPNTLGSDRIAAIVGASVLFPNKDVLVLDAGTCLTIDFIGKEKVYKGGRISPGIGMRYKALHQFTNQLPLCSISTESLLIGENTHSSIISGVEQGILSEVREIINIYKKENKEIIICVTGRDCFFFENEFKNSIFADPFLLMKGLNKILDYNE